MFSHSPRCSYVKCHPHSQKKVAAPGSLWGHLAPLRNCQPRQLVPVGRTSLSLPAINTASVPLPSARDWWLIGPSPASVITGQVWLSGLISCRRKCPSQKSCLNKKVQLPQNLYSLKEKSPLGLTDRKNMGVAPHHSVSTFLGIFLFFSQKTRNSVYLAKVTHLRIQKKWMMGRSWYWQCCCPRTAVRVFAEKWLRLSPQRLPLWNSCSSHRQQEFPLLELKTGVCVYECYCAQVSGTGSGMLSPCRSRKAGPRPITPG